jgi:hypothetical protein
MWWWGTLLASGGFLYCWSTVVGHLSQTRVWSPPWTFLTGALPFYIVAVWYFFISPFAFELVGFTRMLVMTLFGSVAGQWARKAAFPEFEEKASASADLPPPSLFSK